MGTNCPEQGGAIPGLRARLLAEQEWEPRSPALTSPQQATHRSWEQQAGLCLPPWQGAAVLKQVVEEASALAPNVC